MANIKSQKKRILTNEKRNERNKSVKAEVKTRTKRANDTIGTDDNADAVRLAVKRIDSAASKGIIHKNAAARKKSRLMKKVNAAGSPSPTPKCALIWSLSDRISAFFGFRGPVFGDRFSGEGIQRRNLERRATRTSITSSGSRSLAPRRSRSAWARSSIARLVEAEPSRL